MTTLIMFVVLMVVMCATIAFTGCLVWKLSGKSNGHHSKEEHPSKQLILIKGYVNVYGGLYAGCVHKTEEAALKEASEGAETFAVVEIRK